MARNQGKGGLNARGSAELPESADLLSELDAEIEALTAQIEPLATRLAHLKRQRRARVAGLASGQRPRARKFSDERIAATYYALLGSPKARKIHDGGHHYYGIIKETAAQVGCTEQTVQRWLKRELSGATKP